MLDRKKFFAAARVGILGPTLDDQEVSGCGAILDAVADQPLSWRAYALATAYHETAHTMQPIKEFGGPKYLTRMYDPLGARGVMARKMGNTTPGDGIKYCGRGYVQLTWKNNYVKAGAKLGRDLVNNPDLAMRPDIAAAIMRQGMIEGWFTGKLFASYLPALGAASIAQFQAARRIINGTDKALLIAQYALRFQDSLRAGGL